MSGPSLVCSLSGGGVSANSPVQATKFATSAIDCLRILEIYSSIAMVGLSANPYRPSHFAAMYMMAEGYNVIPVNPREKEVLGQPCYASLQDIPGKVEIVDIFRASEDVPPIVDEAIEIGAKVVWMQFGVVNYEAAERARKAGLDVVMDHCVKVEHARFFGGLHLLGLNTGVLSSRCWDPKAGSKRGKS